MACFRYPDKPTEETLEILPYLEGEHIATAKADGWRCLLTDAGAYSRHGNRLDTKTEFPIAIMDAFRAMHLPKGTILDTEWMGRAQANQPHPERPYCYVIGILKWGDTWLDGFTEAYRWDTVNSLPIDGKALRHLPRTLNRFEAFYNQMQNVDEFEGIVLKVAGSGMLLRNDRSGVNPHWLKIKWR